MTWGRRRRCAVILAVLTACALIPAQAVAQPAGCATRNNNTVPKLLECVTVEGVRAHQAAFQVIAAANGGTRASGTPGYDQSAEYVAAVLRTAGYSVTMQEFRFPFFQELSDPALERVSPNPTTFVPNQDFFTMTYSGSGDVTATAVGVDLLLPPTGGSTSGCEAADFAGFPTGQIALIQRGTCTFADKATNAQAAGAVGVILFNEGDTPDRTEPLRGTLGEPGVTIPVVGTSFDIGTSLIDAVVHLRTETLSEPRDTVNVHADLPGRDPDNIVQVGAHLDSVTAGPGIQDNGSGSAVLLEVARNMAKVKPTHTVRFSWWGAEELGLLGSNFYVNDLATNNPEELDKIAAYLNFDMVGSPNFVRFVYDGDQSTFPAPVPVPEGSAQIEDVFEKFYADRGLAFEDTEFNGRSDYQAFILADIPAGGLFTGAEGIKTPEQEALYGGAAGVAYDPCYHQACDDFDNVSLEVLDQNADAVAYATLTLAYSTELINAVPGREPPGSARLASKATRVPGRHDDVAG